MPPRILHRQAAIREGADTAGTESFPTTTRPRVARRAPPDRSRGPAERRSTIVEEHTIERELTFDGGDGAVRRRKPRLQSLARVGGRGGTIKQPFDAIDPLIDRGRRQQPAGFTLFDEL